MRKARRDLWRARGQSLALVLMTALGVAALTAVYGGYANLQDELDRTYDDLEFHDVLLQFQPRPRSDLANVSAVAGVAAAETRWVIDLPITFEGDKAPIIARLISVPDGGQPTIDRLRFESGGPPATLDQVVAEKGFALHHGLRQGDTVSIHGPSTVATVTVSGVAVSPEYVWPAKTVQEHMPDVLRRWGVFWVQESQLTSWTESPPLVNQVVARTAQDAALPDVLADLRERVGAGTVERAETRENQASHAVLGMLTSALNQMGFVLPLVFLTIVGLSTYVLLTRLVHQQRANIGLMRALGYGPGAILRHYLAYAPVIAVAGAGIGFGIGHALSYYVTWIFGSYVSLADIPVQLRWDLLGIGLTLTLVCTTLASFLPARRAANLSPAEAMRPSSPAPSIRRSAGRAPVPYSVTLGLRSLVRNPRRSLLTVFGLGLAVSILVVPQGVIDSLNAAVDDGLTRVQQADEVVVFARPVTIENLTRASAIPGVSRVEPLVQLQAAVFKDGLPLELTVFGLQPQGDLFRLFDREDRRVEARPDGILLSRIFERHGVHMGDVLALYGEAVPVAGFVGGIGSTGYVPLGVAQRWAEIGDAATQAFVAYQPGVDRGTAHDRLGESLPIAATQDVDQALDDARSMLRLYYGFVVVLMAFGLVIAAAIMYNAVAITVLEDSRNYATLRTLGLPTRSIVSITTTQVVGVAVPGAALGLLLGVLLTQYFVGVFASDLFVLDLHIAATTLVGAAAGGLVVAVLAQIPSVRRIARMDLARITRERAA